MTHRYVIATVSAIFITLGIFYVMHVLILVVNPELGKDNIGKIIDFVRLKRESELELRKRTLPKKLKPEEPPPPPELDLSKARRPDQQGSDLGAPIASLAMDISGGPDLEASASSAEAVPIVRVNPMYPERARARGIEGWVHLSFTITTTGGVKDPVVLDSDPQRVFDSSALKAVRKYKYRPKVIDGVPVEQPGQQIVISFELDDESERR
jgi:protein TonB